MPEIPFAHQWTIAENELLTLKDSIDECLDSTSVTNIPEFEYYLQISPNGDNDQHRGKTWIFLQVKFKNMKKVETDCTFTIESKNYSEKLHCIYNECSGWGIKICDTDDFFDDEKKFIVDGKFTVKVDGIFKYENEDDVIPPAIEQKWIGGELGDKFWKKDGSKDFTIISSDGKEIKVHKSVLDVRSDVFTAMLNSNMKESKENIVIIPNFSFNVLESAIKLIYDCNFDSSLSMDELMQLQQFFDKYLLQELKAKIELLINQISPSTVVRLTNASILTNSPKLKEKCMEYLSVSFESKTPLADFDDLEKDIVFSIIKNSFYGTLEIRK